MSIIPKMTKKQKTIIVQASIMAGIFVFSVIVALAYNGVFRTGNEFEREVLRLTNIERRNHDLPTLSWAGDVARVAREHSWDMMRTNNMSHTGSDGSTVGDRLTRAGITFRGWAENVAVGQRTPQEVVTAWMNSPGHRANILNPNLTHLGVGFVERPSGANYQWATAWTQKFLIR